MEPVETAAADTTSDPSPPPHTQPSHPHSYTQSDEPPPKRPRLDPDPPTKPRPIGIAQPLIRQQPKATPDHSDSEESQDSGRFNRLVNESDTKVEAGKDERLAQGVGQATLSQSQGSTGLPWGREWLVFLSHSTSDQPWVREHLLVPLRDTMGIPVTASYHHMPDPSQYDDKAIQKSMANSCLIIIALSPAYVNSERCKREWQLAEGLEQAHPSQYKVVVVLVSSCSRPLPLKKYLYLDFVDKHKRDKAWDKLNETIDECMTAPSGKERKKEVLHHPKLEAPPTHPHDHHTLTGDHHQSNVHPHTVTLDPPTLTSDLHNPHTVTRPTHSDHHPHSISTEFSYPSLQEATQGHMISDFEQMYQENLEMYPPPSNEPLGHVTHGDDHMTPEDNSVHDTNSEYSASSHVTYNTSFMRDDASHVIRGHHEDDHSAEETGHVTDQTDHVIQSDDHVIVTRENKCEDVEEGEVDDSSDESALKQDQASKVTSFYNQLARPEADRRQESPIFYMRNFNNWVKSILIRTYLSRSGASVLDLCCGKGGDLLKWREGRIRHLVCADISDVSVEAAEGRYRSKKMLRRGGTPPFTAEFICADCCQERLRDRYENPGRRFHLTSCQFSIHYSFESYEKAHMMLRNACENILPGGYFIGTTVDANQLVCRLREAGQNEEGLWTFGNDIFRVTLDPSLTPHTTLPLFGAKYNFQLHGVVNLPEYIIHFPTFQSMLEEFDMEFVLRQNFIDFFNERRNRPEDAELLFKMSAFDKATGTMSAGEWEAIGLYMVFVFRKHSNT